MKNKVITIIVSLALIAATIAGVIALKQGARNEGAAVDTNQASSQSSGLKIEDVVTGTGVEATAGKKITVNYTGTLTNGTQFDSSVGRQPFSFTLGAGEVIKGWDQGFAGMKVGGKRKLTIPPEMGYGAQGAGSIPANATLLFDVELLNVE